jgi:hypothetical protein
MGLALIVPFVGTPRTAVAAPQCSEGEQAALNRLVDDLKRNPIADAEALVVRIRSDNSRELAAKGSISTESAQKLQIAENDLALWRIIIDHLVARYQACYGYPPVALAALVTHPTCHEPGWTQSPLTNAVLQETQESIDGGACTIRITTHLPRASVDIITQPSHGTLTQTGALSLVYQPAAGFKGTDHYSFHYCGANDAGQSAARRSTTRCS